MLKPIFLLSALTATAFGQSKPNIIFFFADDLGYGDLGCFWQDQRTSAKKFDTPAIDTMAAEGAKLTHHYVSASVCAPSRASLLTGRHQGHCEVRDNQFDKALAGGHSIASVLKTAGYRTIFIGKDGLAGSENPTSLAGTGSQNLAGHPLARGFDRFFGYLFHADGHEHYPANGTTDKSAFIYNDYQQVTNASLDLYSTDAWTAAAKKEIIDEATDADNQPFFIYLSYDAPHFSMQRPAVAYPSGAGLSGGIQWTNATDASGRVRFANTATGTGTVDAYTHPDIPSAWSNSEKQHVGMIRRIDDSVADIIQTLKDLGIDNNTLCVFSSDNGPHNEGNNPRTFESYANLEGIKRDLLEGGIRVPTIVRWPGQIAGATGNPNNIRGINYPSGLWDWMPTFCQMAGVPAPAWCDGVSLLPTLTGTGTQRDKGYLYFEYQSSGNTPDWPEFPNNRNGVKGQMQALRIGNFMGLRTGITTGSEAFRIYDVTTDSGQGTNLAPSLPAVQAQMQKLAVTARRPGGDVTRPYDGLALPNVTVPLTAPGVRWKSFVDTGATWQWVPEFRDLAPTANGTTTVPTVSVRPADDHFGLLFTGYVQIPAAGNYTFYLNSDTGADLFLHDGHVIADDADHSGAATSSAVNLTAGFHPFRLYYRHATGTRTLSLEWSGPGIGRQAVPPSAFFIETSPPPGPPGAENDSVSAAFNTYAMVDVLANDADDGTPGPLTIQSVGTPDSGTAVIESGQVRYTPPAGFSGVATFNYTVSDGSGADTATVTVTVPPPPGVLWTTTYTGTDGTNRNLVNSNVNASFTDALTANDANLTFQDTSFTGTVFMHSGTMASGTYYSPRTNVDNPGAGSPQNTGWWQADFQYSGGTQTIALTDVVMEMVWSNSSGSIQTSGNSFGTNIRDITLTVQASTDGGLNWSNISSPQTYDVTEADGADQIQLRTFSRATPLQVDHATQNLRLRVRAENAGSTVGAYVNIKSISFLGNVVPPVTTDYTQWAQTYPGADLTNPTADLDGDGLTNNEERIWGLSPTSGSNPNPITSVLNATTRTFTYARRNPSLSKMDFRYEYSTTLSGWNPLTPESVTATGTSPNESVSVVVPAALAGPKIFVRVAAEPAAP